MLSPPKFVEEFQNSQPSISRSSQDLLEEVRPCSPQTELTPHPQLIEYLRQGVQLMEGRQISGSVRKLQQLESKVQVNRNISASIDKTSSIKQYWKLELACNYHIIMGLNELEQYEQIFKIIQKTITLMQRVEEISKKETKKRKLDTHCKSKTEDNLTLCNLIGGDDCTLENNFKSYVLYVRILLFSCFAYSRNQRYEEAFAKVKEAERFLKKIFMYLEERAKKMENGYEIGDKIQFKQVILKSAGPILYHILQIFQRQKIEDSENLIKIRNVVSSWRRNPEKGTHYLKKQSSDQNTKINSNKNPQKQQRTILGVRTIPSVHYKEKRHQNCVKDILTLPTIKFKQLSRAQNIIFEISQEKLWEKIELLCSVYFCLGLQLNNILVQRCINANNGHLLSGQARKKALFSNYSDTQFEATNQSELYLLKSLEVCVYHLKGSDILLQNLIKIYQQKFVGELVPIAEENQRYEMSGSLSSMYQSKVLYSNSISNNSPKQNYFELVVVDQPEEVYYKLEKGFDLAFFEEKTEKKIKGKNSGQTKDKENSSSVKKEKNKRKKNIPKTTILKKKAQKAMINTSNSIKKNSSSSNLLNSQKQKRESTSSGKKSQKNSHSYGYKGQNSTEKKNKTNIVFCKEDQQVLSTLVAKYRPYSMQNTKNSQVTTISNDQKPKQRHLSRNTRKKNTHSIFNKIVRKQKNDFNPYEKNK